MMYFIVIEKTYSDWVDAPNENEAVNIALNEFDTYASTEVWIEDESEEKR